MDDAFLLYFDLKASFINTIRLFNSKQVTMKTKITTLFLLLCLISPVILFGQRERGEGLEQVGKKAFDSGDYPKAIETYSALIKRTNGIKYYFERGKSYRKAKMNNEALADFNTVISKMNSDASFLQFLSTEYNPYNWRGWIKLEMKDYYGGVYDFTQSINLNNSNNNIIYSCEGRGICYYNQNMFKEANEDFSRVISLDPNRLNSLKWRASLLTREEKYNEAINDLLKIIDLEPNAHKIYNDLGVCYVRLKNYQQAYIQYKKASDLAPEISLYYGNTAMCLAYMNKFDEAYNSINKSIELDSLSYFSYYQKARIFALNGKRSDAYKSLNRAFSKGLNDAQAFERNLNDFRLIKNDPEFKLLLDRNNIKINLDKTLASDNQQAQKVSTEAISPKVVSDTQVDVDINIPNNPTKYPYRFALIIGNEDYSSFQRDLNSEVNVEFAERDARIFKEYAVNVFGVPEDNIIFMINARSIEMDRAISKINLLSKNTQGKAELIFYYAGHGFPDEITKEPYIIPVDVSAKDLKYAFKLSEIYKELTEFPNQRVTVFLDACFSGGARNQGLLTARGVKVKPKDNMLTGNIVVYTATSEDQSALPYQDKKHGLFTYFLLKKLKESQGNITYKELSDYLKEQVSVKSILVNEKEQQSQTYNSPVIQNSWGDWHVK